MDSRGRGEHDHSAVCENHDSETQKLQARTRPLTAASFLCGFTREQDASWSWGVFTADGDPIKSGVAETWDDAVLSIAENVRLARNER